MPRFTLEPVTSETPSTKLDMRGFDTTFLFGDAAPPAHVRGETIWDGRRGSST